MYKLLSFAAVVEGTPSTLTWNIVDAEVADGAFDDTNTNCPNGDLMAPVGVSASDLDAGAEWIDDEPCPCVTFATDETPEVSYKLDAEYFIDSVTLTTSNRAGTYDTLDGVAIDVLRDDAASTTLCATASAAVQGDDNAYSCGDRLPLGDTIKLSKASEFEYCGIAISGYDSPDAYYSQLVDAMDAAEAMYDDLTAKYDSMNRDYFKKYNDYQDLRAKYDLLEDDYDAVVAYKDNVLLSTDLLGERELNLDAQLLAVQGEYDLAVADKEALDADNDQRDTNIEAYSEVSTMAEKCMIGPIAGWFWYCREGDALVREEDAEEEEEE